MSIPICTFHGPPVNTICWLLVDADARPDVTSPPLAIREPTRHRMSEPEPPPLPPAAAHGGPRYARIQKALEARLLEGTYPVGSIMPTEVEFAAEFNTSRFTIREALRYLREQGYVERRQGSGTRVISNSPQSTYHQSFGSLEELFQVAVETFFVILATDRLVLAPQTAELIGGIPGEEWFRIKGVRWTKPGGKPICFIESYIPIRFEAVIPTLGERQVPFFSLLEQHADGPIEEVVQEIRALPMPPEIGRQLGLATGAWSLQLLRRYLTDGGVLIASFNWHPAEEMHYAMHIHRSRKGTD